VKLEFDTFEPIVACMEFASVVVVVAAAAAAVARTDTDRTVHSSVAFAHPCVVAVVRTLAAASCPDTAADTSSAAFPCVVAFPCVAAGAFPSAAAFPCGVAGAFPCGAAFPCVARILP